MKQNHVPSEIWETLIRRRFSLPLYNISAGKLLQPGFPDHHSAGTSPLPSSPGEPQVETPEEPPPKPSKRLIILAECVWASDNDRSLVLKELCERMACDQLDKPFWVRQYFISPVAQTAEGGGTDCCIQYKIHISTPKVEPENPAASGEKEQVRWSRDRLLFCSRMAGSTSWSLRLCLKSLPAP